MDLTHVPLSGTGYALAVHGGAGSRATELDADQLAACHDALRSALSAGRSVLAGGGSALDAVSAAVVVLEDDEHFNAGRGAALTEAGTAELDAAVMTGAGDAGAVAGCTSARNPVLAARAVMERTPHVLLVAPGRELLAAWDVPTVRADYFVTERRLRELERRRNGAAAGTTHGTVGAVARAADGTLAAATSTGGMTNQMVGRLGDTAVIGAGTYAEDGVVALSCTGHGEYFIRGVVAHDVAARMRYQGVGLAESVDAAMATTRDRMGQEALGGVIAVDAAGQVLLAFDSAMMFRGHLGPDGEPVTAV